MDIKKIKSLAELLEKYNLTELEYSEENSRILLKKEAVKTISAPQISVPRIEIDEPIDNTYNFNDVREIKSPLVGVFYAAASPESKPYVEIGQRVSKGDILCIVEAMKLMNEITAEYDGEIIDICVQNGQIVEFGQTLFKII